MARFDRDEFTTQFARRLRMARNMRGLSQAHLAHRVGYATQTIGNLERGFVMPPLVAVFMLAEALEVSPKELLFGTEE